MKNYHKLAIGCIALGSLWACQPNEKKQQDEMEDYSTQYAYSVKVDFDSTKKGAPDLQSFAHGVNGSDWLLFAGRTNSKGTNNGGMHDFGNNYARQSFAPLSFNEQIFVYNVDNDKLDSLHIDSLIERIVSLITLKSEEETENKDLMSSLSAYRWQNTFRNTNPLITQDGDFLYVLGGYGFETPQDTLSKYYKTFSNIAKIHIPTMIKVVRNESITLNELKSLMRFGAHESLISTGGEMYMIDNVLYMSGGHKYFHTVSVDTTVQVTSIIKKKNGKKLNPPDTVVRKVEDTTIVNSIQNYVDAVYPFTVTDGSVFPLLDINVQPFISDVSDPSTIAADKVSKFRRRDGPIVPALFQNPTTKALEQGVTFYAGVFTPAGGLWNDAIYVHPSFEVKNSKNVKERYTHDANYNQSNQSVYSCPDFELFDTADSTVHTFLLGGIGNDTTDSNAQQGFTNAGLHIKMDVTTNPLSSYTPDVMHNVFGNDITAPFFGAEAAMILSNGLTFYTTASGNETDLIDLNSLSWSNDQANIGYVFGGIHARKMNNASYGGGGSKASNRVWTVSLTRELITE